MSRYSFSGHESFSCKTLWLKKGYDFACADNKFTDEDAVIKLGVGKNMVSSIRFWLKAFGLTQNDKIIPLAKCIFDDDFGFDPFMEETATLWLLHYQLVKNAVASIYKLTFIDFQREKKEFERDALSAFIKKKCYASDQKSAFNENTVKKDINVLIQNYVAINSNTFSDDALPLLLDLNLIYHLDEKTYAFNETKADDIPSSIMMYVLKDYAGDETTLSFDSLREISLMFCLTPSAMHELLQRVEADFAPYVAYTDNSGIKNIQFLKKIDTKRILSSYYNK